MQKQTERTKPAVKEAPAEVEPKQLETNVDEEALNAVLDEIDNVLEENAEEFVKSYIQKGGE